MNEATAQQLIRQLHRSPWRIVPVIAGGGSDAISTILSVPGASGTVLEACIPYANSAMKDFLGFAPARYCSRETSQAMAMQAFFRARYLRSKESEADYPVGGVGCTASLRSVLPKRGDHRVHIAIQTDDFSSISSLTLTKDSRDRSQEEVLVSAMLLNALAEVAGIGERLPLELLPGERIEVQNALASAPWKQLLLGQRQVFCIAESNEERSPEDFSGVLFPGAFNPLHEGHILMAELGQQMTGKPVEFEISVENVDKPMLDYSAIRERAIQFESGPTCWLTRAPTFVEKARIFPEACFIVGTDTILRIADPRYYGNSHQKRDLAIAELRQQNCRFLVFSRLVKDEFLTLDDLQLPASLVEICEAGHASEFRMDISSTEIRDGT